MRKVPFNSLLPILSFGLVLATVACGDDNDPTGVAEPDKPEMVQVRAGSITLANATEFSANGNLIVAQGETAGPAEIVFLDNLGNPMSHGPTEYLEVSVGDEAVTTWLPEEQGGFIGSFQGRTIGETELVFRLMFGEPGDAKTIFTSAPITLLVTE